MLQMGVGSGPDGFYIVCVCPYLSNAPVCGRTFPELVSEGGGEGTSRGCPLPVSTVTSEHSLAPSLEPCQHFLGWVKLCQSSPQDFLIE